MDYEYFLFHSSKNIMQTDHSYWIIAFFENADWEREFLLINQKSDNGSFRWYPKWHAEKWEDWLQAAKREFWEEVGIKDVKIVWNKTFDTEYIFHREWLPDIHKTVTFWVGKVEDKEVKIQIEELNWYKRANFEYAMNTLSHKNYKDLLKKVAEYLKG